MASNGNYELLCLENPLLDIQGVGYVNWPSQSDPKNPRADRNITRVVGREIQTNHESIETRNS